MSRETTRLNILNTALDLFASLGFTGVTTKQIAEQAGITEVTLFRHFPTKRNLFNSVLEEIVRAPLLESIRREDFTWDLSVDLMKISSLIREVFEKNSRIMQMNMKDIKDLTGGTDGFLNFPNRLKDLLKGYFAEYCKRYNRVGDAELLAVGFLSSLFGLAMNYFVVKAFETDTTYDDVAAQVVELYALGMRK